MEPEGRRKNKQQNEKGILKIHDGAKARGRGMQVEEAADLDRIGVREGQVTQLFALEERRTLAAAGLDTHYSDHARPLGGGITITKRRWMGSGCG